MSAINANTQDNQLAGALALKELGEQLGAIESKSIWADISTTPSHFEAIKSYWEEFELGKIYLVNVMCGSQKIAIVQKYVYAHNYGSVFMFGYDQKCLMYYELVNGEWVTYDVANKNDLANYLPLSGGTLSAPLFIKKHGASYLTYRLDNGVRDVEFMINDSGNCMLYDNTRGGSILISMTDGTVEIPNTTRVKGSKVLTAADFSLSGTTLTITT